MHVLDLERVHSHLADTLTALADALASARHHPEDIANLTSALRHLRQAHASLLAVSNRQRQAHGLAPMKPQAPKGFSDGPSALEH